MSALFGRRHKGTAAEREKTGTRYKKFVGANGVRPFMFLGMLFPELVEEKTRYFYPEIFWYNVCMCNHLWLP
ncbi:MAG: hypothetical protein JXB48_04425 [Candidatus Latescibacteria bacterium]|nr:hypothetical protein [Candidatus Latescibacterota bacterium]